MADTNINQPEIHKDFVVTARKWRPLKFKDVVGQSHITSTLKNAIKLGRVHHAFLFSGPRGVGKTTTARIFARALNCLAPVDFEPCNECENCRAAIEGASMDVIEIDGASNNSVEDVRKLRENAKYAPTSAKYKMYIIDEVHMLSTSAFNALLKTLEEPPPHLVFVFATTESHKVPATIISRCQRFDFRRMEINDIVGQLVKIAEKENIQIDRQALFTIAKKADGSMRDSQSIFDQVVAFCGDNITYASMTEALHLIDEEFFFEISDAIKARNAARMFEISEETLARGYDLTETLQGLLEHFRNLLAVKVTSKPEIVKAPESVAGRYLSESLHFKKADLLLYISVVSRAEMAIKTSPQARIRFELALVELASLPQSAEVAELLAEMRSAPRAVQPAASEPPHSYAARPAAPIAANITSPSVSPGRIAPQPTERQPSQSPQRPPGASRENLSANWEEFLKFNSANGGASSLRSVTPQFENGQVTLYCAGFVFAGIRSKQSQIKAMLDKFFQANVELLIMESDGQTSPKIEKKNMINEESSLRTPAPRQSEQLHPVERAIMDIFNAKPND